MKKYVQVYDFKSREKELQAFKDKVIKILHAKLSSNLSFAEISRALNLPDRTVAYKIYAANKNNTELTKIATVDK